MDTRHDFEKYLDRIYENHARQWAFRGKTAEAFRLWQRRTRRGLLRLLTMKNRERVPLRLCRKVQRDTEHYIREKVHYQTLPGVVVPAYLFIPKRVKLPVPAVLCPPGHGGGMNQVVDESPGIYKQYPLELVRRGMVALVPEHLGFGERAGEKGNDTRSNHAYLYLSLNLLGESQMGLMIWDLMRAVDVLQVLPEVRADRIGCYGLSLGGETTMLLSAVDTRIRAVCCSGFISSYKSSFLDQCHCGCGYSFALCRYLEHVDIASLIVPRPLAIESAVGDPIFPVATARKTYRQLRKLYALSGAQDRITQDVFEGGHEISGAIAYDWMERWLEG